MPLLKEKERFTYLDYCTWDDTERWELVDGIPYAMSPAPSWIHQRVSGRLYFQFAGFLKGKSCEVFAAPFDVRLNAETGDDTVVQPDLVIICDRSKLSGTGCTGAPDMVIEILSPSSESHDRVLKFNRYLRAGVREYWIVAPDSKTVSVHVLKNGEYVSSAFADADAAPVSVLDGCTISLQDVFAE